MDSKKQQDTACSRLLALLTTAQGKNRQSTLRHVWAEVLSVEPTDNIPALLEGLVAAISLTREARAEVAALPNVNSDIYLRPFDIIERAFFITNLDAQWNAFATQLDGIAMISLEFCADAVQARASAVSIAQEELEALIEEASALEKHIIGAGLPADLTSFVLDQLQAIEKALLRYKIAGVSGLERAFDSVVGATLRHGDRVKEAAHSEESKSTVAKYFDIVSKLGRLIAIAKDTKELVGPILVKYLVSREDE